MEEQERAREQLQQDRRDAVQRGDFESLVSGISGARSSAVTPSLTTGAGIAGGEGFATPGTGPVGRGRGRGNISNLPSWMTQGAITPKTAAAVDLAPPSSAGSYLLYLYSVHVNSNPPSLPFPPHFNDHPRRAIRSTGCCVDIGCKAQAGSVFQAVLRAAAEEHGVC